MKYKLIVFDLDGTLVNSLTDLAIAVNEGLKKAGLVTHSVEKYKTFVGNGRDKLVDRAMGESHTDKKLRAIVKNTFDEFYAVHCNDNTDGYPGCAQMLSVLSEHGVKTAVLSNKPDEFVSAILGKIYPDHKFTAAWGKRSEFSEKPNPASLLAMLDELKVEKADCLYIGDSNVDIFTGQNAGVDVIGVEWGFRDREELIEAGADFVAKSTDEILEYIR